MSTSLLADYAAFNRGDSVAMLALVNDDVVHEPSPDIVREGKAAFGEFLDHMDRCYKEEWLTQYSSPRLTVSAARQNSCGRGLRTSGGRD